MNIEKIKELGKLKEDLSGKGELFEKMYYKKKERYLSDAAKDFQNFFKSKGFNVTDSNSSFVASYGNAKIQLNIPKLKDDYMGVYSVFDFLVQVLEKKEYTIELNPFGRSQQITSTISTASSKPKTENEKLDEEINLAKERLDNINNQLEDLDSEAWGFKLLSKGVNRYDSNVKQYESVNSLLTDHFK